MITEQLLRDCVKEAQEKGQFGLMVWISWKDWDDLGCEVRPGSEYYDFALYQIQKEEEATIDIDWGGLYGAGILAVSVKKLISSDEYFKDFLKVCEINQMKGPIVLIPSNKLSEHC